MASDTLALPSSETAPCVLCGNAVFAAARLPHLRRCAVCGLIAVREFPDPAGLAEVYGEAYFRSERSELTGYDDYEADRRCIVRTAHRRLDHIERYVPRLGRLLDVGCALGFFLDAARSRGWDVEGIDISAHAASYARETLKLPVRTGVIESASFEPASFDVLTLWDVIEHVPDPVASLRHCASLLRPGGHLVLATPDAGSLVARLAGPRWMGYKLAEEHLTYFSRRTIALALAKAGLETRQLSGVGKDVAVDFFAKRLALYARPAAAAAARAAAAAHLSHATVYVNPRDILCAVARRPAE